jgi:bacterioferritin-associated ferredoxin
MKLLGVASDCGRCLQTAIDKYLEATNQPPVAAKNTGRQLKQN